MRVRSAVVERMWTWCGRAVRHSSSLRLEGTKPIEFPADLAKRLDPVNATLPDSGSFQYAAVLALIMPAVDPRGERLLLIERSRGLTTHAGQLAFPGGKREPGDRDLLDTALRESHEEVGLDRHSVKILGRLEPVPTPTKFFILPFVGRITDAWTPRICSGEVAAILTPALSELCDPNLHSVSDVRRWRGRDYHLHEFAIHDPPLWGATARMTYELLVRASLVEAP